MNRPWPLCLFLSIVASVLGSTSRSSAGDARAIARVSFPSVVMLIMEDRNGQPISLGSGFFVADGVVASNLHVARGAHGGIAKIVGQTTTLDISGVVAIDEHRDLVLLSVAHAHAASLPLGSSSEVTVGDNIYVVGNPQGLEGTLSDGIVSGIRGVMSDTLLQITAPISPGSSGGPVLNEHGLVVGVAVATFDGGQNLNFAIPSSYVITLMSRMADPVALSTIQGDKKPTSLVTVGGSEASAAIVATQLTWNYLDYPSGAYSFSLRNRLRVPVKHVQCLVVFYDRSGQPLDADAVKYFDEIPAGLAKRVTGNVDDSVRELTSQVIASRPDTKVDIRVLDFDVVR